MISNFIKWVVISCKHYLFWWQVVPDLINSSPFTVLHVLRLISIRFLAQDISDFLCSFLLQPWNKPFSQRSLDPLSGEWNLETKIRDVSVFSTIDLRCSQVLSGHKAGKHMQVCMFVGIHTFTYLSAFYLSTYYLYPPISPSYNIQ